MTTACDVYALGAILFELLSGRRPNQDSSVALMIERSIKELAPEPITEAVTAEAAERRGLNTARLVNLLRGDLATIAAKCLAPRPKDRYASVDALVTDIERYLAGRPILARPQTTTYRLGKFVRRHRTSVVLGSAALVALIVTSSYAIWRQEQAVRAGRRAVQMQTFMYRLFKLANSNYAGKPALTIPEFLSLGVKILPDFIKNSADQRAAKLSLAESMFDNGDLGDAQRVFLEVIAAAKAEGDVGAEAEAEGFASYIAYTQGQAGSAETLASHALAISQEPGVTPSARVWIEVFAVAEHQNTGVATKKDTQLLKAAVEESRSLHLPDRETAFALITLAEYLGVTGRVEEGEPYLNEAIAIYDREPYALCDKSETYIDLGYVRAARADIPGSLEWYHRAYDGFRSCLGADSERTLMAQQYIASDLLRLGRAKEVVPLLEPSLPAWRKQFNHSPEMYQGLANLAQAYIDTGEYAKAEGLARELNSDLEGKVDAHSSHVADTELLMAQALAGQHRLREALPLAQAADNNYASQPGANAIERERGGKAHRLRLDLEAAVAAPASRKPSPVSAKE